METPVQKDQQTEQPKTPLKSVISSAKLIEAGVHIGFPPRKWNPQMRPYIKGRKGNAHIIDVNKTMKVLESAYQLIHDISVRGGKIMFVGTKGKTIKQQIYDQARRAQANYVTQRWLGGTLTNFKTISNSIQRLNDLVVLDKTGEIAKYPKKEQIQMLKEIDKLIKFVGGIMTMRSLPDLIIIVDPKSEVNAVKEAKKMGVATIGLANTNGSPDDTDILIPMNTNSPRSVVLILQILADAATEARNEPTLVVGKPEDQIVLIEEKRPLDFTARTGHKSFMRRSGPPSSAKPSDSPSAPAPKPVDKTAQ